jgi:hypothetical protein
MQGHRLIVAGAAAFTAIAAAQMADLVTFLRMVAVHGLAAEANPLVALGGRELGLEMLVVAKVVLTIFVAATFLIVAQVHRRLAASVLTLGTVVGLFGAFTNIIST